MLLIQVPQVNSEPCQAYKMGFLANIVNGLKFILRLIHVKDIKGLFVWTLGSLIRVIHLVWKLKKTICFVTFNHLDHDPLDPG